MYCCCCCFYCFVCVCVCGGQKGKATIFARLSVALVLQIRFPKTNRTHFHYSYLPFFRLFRYTLICCVLSAVDGGNMWKGEPVVSCLFVFSSVVFLFFVWFCLEGSTICLYPFHVCMFSVSVFIYAFLRCLLVAYLFHLFYSFFSTLFFSFSTVCFSLVFRLLLHYFPLLVICSVFSSFHVVFSSSVFIFIQQFLSFFSLFPSMAFHSCLSHMHTHSHIHSSIRTLLRSCVYIYLYLRSFPLPTETEHRDGLEISWLILFVSCNNTITFLLASVHPSLPLRSNLIV